MVEEYVSQTTTRGDVLKRIVDLSQESPQTKRLYGIDNSVTEGLGHQCLLARRLGDGPRRSETLNEQLQGALNSRVLIEQAKGKLAERVGLDMDQAFTMLRAYARDHNLRLSDLAQAFIDGTPADFPGLAASVGRKQGR